MTRSPTTRTILSKVRHTSNGPGDPRCLRRPLNYLADTAVSNARDWRREDSARHGRRRPRHRSGVRRGADPDQLTSDQEDPWSVEAAGMRGTLPGLDVEQ